MKKIVTLCMLLLSAQSMACSLNTFDSPTIRSIVKERGGYPISDEICNFLNKKGISLYVSGSATVLDGVAVSWVQVKLWKNGVVSDDSRYDTTVNAKSPSVTTAEDNLYKALETSIPKLDYKVAAAQVEGYLALRGKKQ